MVIRVQLPKGLEVEVVAAQFAIARQSWEGHPRMLLRSLFSAFGYFEDDTENEQVLHQVASVLKPGGAFLLDVANRDYCLLRLWPNSWHQLGQAAILEETTFDPLTSVFTTTFTWAEKGKWESLTHLVRHYTAPELSGMIERAGLVPVAYYGDFEREEFDLYSSRLIVIAEKPRE